MKVAIIGYGFVGKALKKGLAKNVEVSKIDPILGTTINSLKNFNPNFTFICLPTPMKNDGSQNIEILKSVITELSNLELETQIVIKSTILPSNIKKIIEIDNCIILNPEFLREKHAEEDFINSNLIVFGGDHKKCQSLSNFYKKYTKCLSKDHVFTDVFSASLIKYSINSFLASKVIFFNQLKEVLDQSDATISWDDFTKILSKDSRIGHSHMDVPGNDNRFGYGGACFPKDTAALYEYSRDINAEFTLLKKVISVNNFIRAKYNVRTEREIEQNINFDIKEKEK